MRKLFYVFYTCWIRKNFKQMNGIVKSPIFLCGGKYKVLVKILLLEEMFVYNVGISIRMSLSIQSCR